MTRSSAACLTSARRFGCLRAPSPCAPPRPGWASTPTRSWPVSVMRPATSTGSAAIASSKAVLGSRMSIFLIRHGETLGNASGTIQLPDSPLSPRGLAQAERLARRLQSERISAILSSDFARAATTAEHLRIATGAPVAYDPLLQERNFGDIRGKTRAELGFDMFAPDYAPPNGETWEVFHTRVDRAWRRVQAAAAAAGGHLA